MKKIISALLCAAILFSISACAKKDGGKGGEKSGGDTAVQVTETAAASETQKTDDAAGAAVAGGETEIIVGEGEWKLPGTLTLPDGDGPFALVVFVHGSGPCDRDETVGKQKLFSDLALALAELGIASLRYDKRTYVYGSRMTTLYDLTVKEEVIDDVLLAVECAKAAQRVDPERIYVAGHSLGGYLIPKIDEADTADMIAGYISLAGAFRPMTELMIEQIDYILSYNTTMTDSEKAEYRKTYTDADAQVKALTDADRGKKSIILGAFPSYWLDLRSYDPAKAALNISEPILFLQGEHDYQVTMTDFGLWKKALADKENSVFISYPKLSHTFCETYSMSLPTDYETYASADGKVAADIRDFILK